MTRRFVVRLVLALALAAAAIGTVAAQQDERFYIVGYVKSPGSYRLKAEMTVAQAIDAAGGVAPNRTISNIEVIRTVDGETQRTPASLDDRVLPNDTISLK